MLTVGAGFFTFLVLIHDDLVRLHQPQLGPLVVVLARKSKHLRHGFGRAVTR